MTAFTFLAQKAGSQSSNVRDNSMLGVFIPQHLTEYIALYSLTKNQTRSKIVREMLIPPIQSRMKRNPTDKLIEELSASAQRDWDTRKTKRRITGTSLDTYRGKLRKALLKKGVSEDSATLISNSVK